jgi:hypothetical protein
MKHEEKRKLWQIMAGEIADWLKQDSKRREITKEDAEFLSKINIQPTLSIEEAEKLMEIWDNTYYDLDAIEGRK